MRGSFLLSNYIKQDTNCDYVDENGNEYYVNEVENLDSLIYFNPLKRIIELPQNVLDVIRQDIMAKPLFNDSERPYKLVFNKENNMNQQIVRMTVRRNAKNLYFPNINKNKFNSNSNANKKEASKVNKSNSSRSLKPAWAPWGN
jgi:hypothetical protein